MADPISLAIGINADGSAVNLYTGNDVDEAAAALVKAGEAGSVVSGQIYRNLQGPYQTIDFDYVDLTRVKASKKNAKA